MSDEFAHWTNEEKALAFDEISKALCDCSAAGPCSICDTIWYGGDLSKPVIDRFKEKEKIIDGLCKDLYIK